MNVPPEKLLLFRIVNVPVPSLDNGAVPTIPALPVNVYAAELFMFIVAGVTFAVTFTVKLEAESSKLTASRSWYGCGLPEVAPFHSRPPARFHCPATLPTQIPGS